MIELYSECIFMPCSLLGRNATKFVVEANSFKDSLYMCDGAHRCNAKSLLGILSLSVRRNCPIIFETDAENYKEVFDELKLFLETEEWQVF